MLSYIDDQFSVRLSELSELDRDIERWNENSQLFNAIFDDNS